MLRGLLQQLLDLDALRLNRLLQADRRVLGRLLRHVVVVVPVLLRFLRVAREVQRRGCRLLREDYIFVAEVLHLLLLAFRLWIRQGLALLRNELG